MRPLKQRLRRSMPLVFLLAQIAMPAAGVAQQPSDNPPIPPGIRPANATRLGALSCAATACHGSVTRDPRPGNIWRNEYVHWIENDPHARAYDTLSNQRSKVMLAKLDIQAKKGDAGYQNCLACHSPSPTATSRRPNDHVGFGVDCESCHGPASDWLADHYLPSFERASSSMADTKNLTVRAELCAKCHVGADDRQVNHDLIAAGHPALKFEFAAYHDMLPKHWDDAAERRGSKDLEMQLWIAGQAAAIKATLRLLASQAERAVANDANSVWPEFSHYDCYACHHDLAAPSWRQDRGFGGRKPGALPWGSWYFRLYEKAAGAEEVATALTALRGAMEGSFRPRPEEVARLANRALAELATTMPKSSSQVRQAIIDTPPVAENWDIAAQTYLLIVALHQSALDRDEADAELTKPIAALRNKLAFPKGMASPRDFVGTSDLGGQTPSQVEVQTAIDKILQQWKQRSGAAP